MLIKELVDLENEVNYKKSIPVVGEKKNVWLHLSHLDVTLRLGSGIL